MYAVAARIASRPAGLASAGLYLFLPFAISASRGFQPDPLMTALVAAFVWSLLRWHDTPTIRSALLAGLVGGLAIFVKAVAIFFVVGAFAGLVLAAMGPRRLMRSPQVWLITVAILLPGTAYTAFGVFVNGTLGSQFQARFIPSVLTDPMNYALWSSNVSLAVGLFIVPALAGTVWTKERAARGMLAGWWLGYLLYSIAFDYHAATHSYYQLPLVPLVAVSMAGFLHALPERVRAGRFPGDRGLSRSLAAITILCVLSVGATAAASGFELRHGAKARKVAIWAHLSEVLQTANDHPPAIVGLTENEGYRAAYWGWFKVTPWPRPPISGCARTFKAPRVTLSTRFAELADGKQYFLVTNKAELARQPELADYLERRSRWPTRPRILIYDLSAENRAIRG